MELEKIDVFRPFILNFPACLYVFIQDLKMLFDLSFFTTNVVSDASC